MLLSKLLSKHARHRSQQRERASKQPPPQAMCLESWESMEITSRSEEKRGPLQRWCRVGYDWATPHWHVRHGRESRDRHRQKTPDAEGPADHERRHQVSKRTRHRTSPRPLRQRQETQRC